MSDPAKRPEPDTGDPQEIRQSLRLLDRSTSWFWWNTIIGLILLLAALGELSPLKEVWGSFLQPFDANAIVRGLLAIMLISNAYPLYHQRHFKLFRHRLAEQMQIAVEQRMRADKFYG